MSLAHETATILPPVAKSKAVRIQELFANTEGFLREINVPKDSQLCFEIDGVAYNARLIHDGGKSRIIIWAALGYLPYSVVDPVKRKNIIQILEGAHHLPTARMGIDAHMQILVKGVYEVSVPPPPDYFIVPLIKLLQESRPFIALIGENL